MVRSGSRFKKSQKIGILGGAFDPVHFAHLLLAEHALTDFDLDKIILLPYNISVWKERPRASAKNRLDMLRLATIDNPRIEVSDVEIKRGGISYSYETFKYLKNKNPEDRLYFLIGSDAFSRLESWKNYRSLIKMVSFIVAVRPKTKVKKIKNVEPYKILIPQIEISSSYLRNRVQRGLSLRYLLPDKVRDYIINFGLYR